MGPVLQHQMTQALWPREEAVREVFTEEMAKELGLEKEARWAGVARLTRAERKGAVRQQVHRLRIMKGHPPSARGKERASGDWMWHEGEKGEGLRDWMWHEGEAWRGEGSSEGQQWRKMSLRVGMEPEG